MGGGSNNYSLEEQVVGTWIDGKPIYQKTYALGDIPPGETVISYGGLSIDKLLYRVGTSDYIIFPSGHETPLYTIYFFWDSPTGCKIKNGTSNPTFHNVYMTIQYTKTTD